MSTGAPFDDLAKRRYCVLLSRGRPPRLAAEDMGFTYRTVRKHIGEDEAFRDEVEEALVRRNENVEEALYDAALDGNVTAMKEWLHNRAPREWSDVRQIQHVGAGGGPIVLAQAQAGALRAILVDPSVRSAALELMDEIPAVEVIDVEGYES